MPPTHSPTTACIEDNVGEIETPVEGAIALRLREQDGFWLLNVGTGEPVPTEWLAGQPVVSPSGSRIAHTADSTLVISKPNGDVEAEFPWDSELGSRPQGWFDEQWLFVAPPIAPTLGLVLISSLDGHSMLVKPDLPYPSPEAVDRFDGAVYSPDLNLVVYMRSDPALEGDAYALWDLDNDEVIWRSSSDIRLSHAMFTFPAWSPDGRLLAITDASATDVANGVRRQELLIVSRSGLVVASSGLDALYDEYWISRDLMWSPDSTMVAFWAIPIAHGIPRTYRLFALDVMTGSLINLCVESDDIPDMAWSPGSSMVAAMAAEEGIRTLVISDSMGEALTLIPSIEPGELLGWLHKPATTE